MGRIKNNFDSAFRDHVTLGVPGSGANPPNKLEIRGAGEVVDAITFANHCQLRRLNKLTEPVVTTCGDSIIQQGNSNGLAADYMQSTAYGEMQWARQYMPSFNHDTWYDSTNTITSFAGGNQGRSGYSLNGLITGDPDGFTLANLLDSRRHDLIVIARGINDIWLLNHTSTQVLDNFTNAIEACRRRNIDCLVFNLRPVATTGASAITDATKRSNILAVNSGLPARIAAFQTTGGHGSRVMLCDVNAALNNGSNEPVTGTTYDGLHTNVLGSERVARLAIVPALKKMFASALNQPYDRQVDNILSNGHFSGTAGTKGARVTGTVATGWTAAFNDASPIVVSGGAVSAAAAVETYGVWSDTSQRQRFIITPAGSNGMEHLQVSLSSVSIPSTALNKWVRGYVAIDLSAWNGWRGVMLSLSAGAKSIYGNVYYLANQDEYPNVGMNFTIVTEPFFLTAGTVLSPIVDVFVKGAGASGTGTIYIRDMYYGEAEDPRIYRGYL